MADIILRFGRRDFTCLVLVPVDFFLQTNQKSFCKQCPNRIYMVIYFYEINLVRAINYLVLKIYKSLLFQPVQALRGEAFTPYVKFN